jgi:Putative MetA-pathway of phenol degradation
MNAIRSQIRIPLSLLIAAGVFSVPLTFAAKGQTVQATPAGQVDAEQDPEYDGLDVTRPQNKFETRFVYRTSGITNQVTQGSTLLRLDHRVDLEPQWKLGILTQLPIIARETISLINPNGERDWGIGDAYIEPTLVRNLNPQWSVAFGTRIVAPTAEDGLGTGKLQVLPLFAVRYEWAPDTYFAPLVRYAVSVAGDPARRNISVLEFAPTLNIGLPDHWFIALYPSPDIRINYGEPMPGQTGRLFLPADLLLGRKMSSNFVLSFEISAPIIKDYPVYNFRTELRIQFVF